MRRNPVMHCNHNAPAMICFALFGGDVPSSGVTKEVHFCRPTGLPRSSGLSNSKSI
jgi:hypothetical protein